MPTILLNRLPIEGSDKELVLINLQLEAYDDGEGEALALFKFLFSCRQADKSEFTVTSDSDKACFEW